MPRTAMNKPENMNDTLKENANNVFNQSSALTEVVKMPSRGMIPGVPKEVTIRAIQRKDKKKMLMSETDNILLSLLQYSIVAPTDFNVYNLLPFESEYLLYRLRILTYGPNHTFKHKCQYCGETNDVEMDLNSIPILELPDKFKITFDITLPVSGNVLTCKLLSEGEKLNINKQAKELKNATGNDNVDIDMIWEARIVAINGNSKIAPIEKSQFLDEMNDYDSEYFMEYYIKYEGNYGLQTKLKYSCDKCGKMNESDMPSIYTFFRPTFTFPTTF